MRRLATLAMVLGAVGACNNRPKSKSEVQHSTVSARASAASNPTVTSAPGVTARAADRAVSTPVAPVVHHGIAWYRDEPNAALAKARQLERPLLVDLWAPWCHTCLSMQHAVLTAEKLPGLGEQFVALAIDTEREKNAEFLTRYPVSVWPTFYVLDAETGKIAGRWLGAASPAQFQGFLRDAKRTFELQRTSAMPVADPLARIVAGDELAAKQDFRGAADKYLEALANTDRTWNRRPDVLVAAASALIKSKAYGECVDLALEAMDQAGAGISAADFASYAIACADSLPATDSRVRATRIAAEKRLRPLCESASTELSPDDRGDACGSLRRVRLSLGDMRGAEQAALTRLAVLEAAAKGASDEVALTYDFARSDTLLELGRASEAIELLQQREKALPNSYNPPHHLARVYKSLKRWDEGLAAIDRALSKAYGPRRASLMTLKVDLLFGKGLTTEARRALEDQLAAYRALPPGQRQPAAEERVLQRLASLQ
jgi:thiol-disulfide isomerase/thioredoxin